VAGRRDSKWGEYWHSLRFAFGFALVSVLFFPAPWLQRLLIAVFSGFVFGSLFFAAGFVFKCRVRSFALSVILRTFTVCSCMVAGLVVIMPIAISLDRRMNGAAPWNPRVLEVFAQIAPQQIPIWCGIGILVAFGIASYYGIDRLLGPGNLWRKLTGKYHSPKEEERIFMFLDLRNSTTLAEKLGNVRFSRLCQDFFWDLTNPVIDTKGEISHYIGDEAVLSWLPKNGLPSARCLDCFFRMREQIESRAEHYRSEYGIIPEFKAGAHIGPVVAAEVGEIKSEIVFHGDVLNTTARITGLCSEMRSDLLISGDLLHRLTLPEALSAQSLGMKLLKGKEQEVEVVAVASGPAASSGLNAGLGGTGVPRVVGATLSVDEASPSLPTDRRR